MDVVQITEVGMLVLFGFSWPFNIYKSWKSGTAKGKSIQFEIIVELGYLLGLIGKFVTFSRTGVLAVSVWFYIADILMVAVDMVFYIRNLHRDASIALLKSA